MSIFGTDYETPDGTGVRDYIHVSDLASAHVLALDALVAQPRKSMTMNCGYGRGFSVLEVLDAVDRVTGSRIERIFGGRRAGDPAMLVADSTLLRATVPWVPRYDRLETIIEHAVAWEEKLPAIRRSAA